MTFSWIRGNWRQLDATVRPAHFEYCVCDDSVEGFHDGVPLNVWDLEDVLYGAIAPWDELKMLFDKHENTGFGEMTMDRFRCMLADGDFQAAVGNYDAYAMQRLQARANTKKQPLTITSQEFLDLVTNKRRRSFTMAMHERDMPPLRAHALTLGCVEAQTPPPHKLHSKKARFFYSVSSTLMMPGVDADTRTYYSLQYSCCPPPLFIPLLSLLHAVLFAVIYVQHRNSTSSSERQPVLLPLDAWLMFRSDQRYQLWRYLLYALVHAGWWHLAFNLIVQLFIGVPLEMLHGATRVSLVYASGVLAGSLSTGLLDSPHVCLIGASGGVYALLTAHLVNVLLNYSSLDCGVIWLVCCMCIASLDVSLAIWHRYIGTSGVGPTGLPVSYLAHLAGASAGLVVGYLLLKRIDGDDDRKADGDSSPRRGCVWWTLLVLLLVAAAAAVAGNVLIDIHQPYSTGVRWIPVHWRS